MANEKRLIDANALMDAFRSYMVERYDKEKCVSEEKCKTCDRPCLWWRKVNKAPTVDAVEVVRCKNCTHNRKAIDEKGHGIFCSIWGRGWHRVEPDDYCSYGERKDNGMG